MLTAIKEQSNSIKNIDIVNFAFATSNPKTSTKEELEEASNINSSLDMSGMPTINLAATLEGKSKKNQKPLPIVVIRKYLV